ncbi:hypothetical protein BsWGS_23989 [Bradybaena similaris]
MSSHQKNGMDSNGVSSDGETDLEETFDAPEDELLYAARHGKEEIIMHLLIDNEREDGKRVNVNCKGREKSNRGWTPLHLAAYFGHPAAVRVLLEFGAGVNILNACGESGLHLAAYTGREEVVGLLLQHGADTNILNTQGQTPRDVAKTQHIVDMINAAESTASLRMESEFLEAAATGESEMLSQLLNQSRSLKINTQDAYGNSALHLAALRGHGPAAVLLLQHGIDTNLRNKSGQLAWDVAQSARMKQVLELQPIREIYSQPQRFEGPLLKKSRFVGFKQLWVVLDRGVLSYFQNRGDASTGTKRKGMKYLDEAKVLTNKIDPGEMKINFSDGSSHTLHIEPSIDSQVAMQKWLNAFREHISFSTHYTHQGEDIVDDIADDIVSLGTMQDSLQNAQAHRGHLEKQVNILKQCIEQISKLNEESGSKGKQVIAPADLRIVTTQCLDILKSSHNMYQALSHCMALLSQQEELRQNQLKEERERCRMLQDSLHTLATEHHELEKSLSRRPSFLSSMDEEFFDCDDDDDYGIPTVEDFSATQTQGMVLDEANHVNCAAAMSYGRTKLPVPMFSRSDFSFWSILKQCIGKELSKITMPVVFNEPLSFIQRLAEYMEYAPLVEKAAYCDNPIERMEYVAAFAVSALSSNWGRIGKPFNPLLGETYELDRPDLGFRFIGEQVSHHPPITAFNADGRSYTFHGSIQPKLKFWGKSVEISPKGVITLTLHEYNETYTWQNVNCVIHNVIVGSLWVEHYGVMEITCNKSNISAVINFKQSGWFAKDLHHVEGFIYRGKVKERALYGTWVLGLYSCSPEAYEKYMSDISTKAKHSTKEKKDEAKPAVMNFNHEIPGQKTLWKVNPRPPHSDEYYHFSLFAMSLNELTSEMVSTLPPTDSRFRPDIRSMEDGKIDHSAEEKNRVEEKQREARNDRKKLKKEWQPRWFHYSKDASSGREDWVFDPDYWKRNWTQCADIF